MRDILSDVIKHTTSFDVIKITGTDAATKIEAANDDHHVVLVAELKQPEPDLKGVFGMPNLPLLGGLLNFSSYLANGATFTVKRKSYRNEETVEQLEFADASGAGKSIYRCMAPDLIPEQAKIGSIPWDISLTPNKSRLAEFEQLNRLYSSIDPLFTARTDKDGNLIFAIGDDNSSTHRGSVVFETGANGVMAGDPPAWPTKHFLATMKLAGDNPVTLRLTGRGVLGVEIESPFALYKFYIRSSTR